MTTHVLCALILVATFGCTAAFAENPSAAAAARPGPAPADGMIDLHAARPRLPEMPATLTAEMKVSMAAFTKTFGGRQTFARGKGVKPEALKTALEHFEALGMRRDASGVVATDGPILYNGEHALPKDAPAGSRDFTTTLMPVMHELRAVYGTAKEGSPEAAELEKAIRTVFDYFSTRDWNASRPEPLWVGNGYTFRGVGPGYDFLALAHLLPTEGQRASVAENVWWMLDGSKTLVDSPSLSTDTILNTLPQALAAVAALPDGPAKWQRILVFKRALDLSVVGNDYNLISPDGGVIHHGGYHISYAGYSFGAITGVFERFATCGIRGQHDAEIIRRFRLAGVQWAWVNLPDGVAPNLQMRVVLPFVTEKRRTSYGVDFALSAGRAIAAMSGIPIEKDSELAGLVLARQPDAASAELRAAWAKEGFVAKPISGHLSLPCAGAELHRRGDWMLVVRGQNKFMRGGEGMPYGAWGARNTFGGRFCHGSIFIADSGTPPGTIDSGWIADGFDYSRVPGTTGPVLGWRDMVGGYFGTPAVLAGGCALDDQGIFAFAEGSVRKSCFMVDDRITYVTGGVVAPETGKTMTTVFQAAENTILPISIDAHIASPEFSITLDGKQPHTLLDGRARGYYFHAGSDDIAVERGDRHWTYTEVKGRKADQKRPPESELATLPATRSQYASAGYTQSAEFPGRVDAFTLLMKSDAGKLARFASAMASSKPPVTMTATETAHTFRDTETGMCGVCLFVAGDIPDKQRPGEIAAVSRPCTLLERKVGAVLRLSVASTDIKNLLPFVIRLKGAWKADALPTGATLEPEGQNTLLTIPYKNQTARFATLRAK